MIGLFERSAENFLPFIGHVRPGIVLMADGSLLAMLKLRGLAHELSVVEERRANANNVLNNIYMSVGQDNVTLGTHFIRRKQFRDFDTPTFTNEFSEALDRPRAPYKRRRRTDFDVALAKAAKEKRKAARRSRIDF